MHTLAVEPIAVGGSMPIDIDYGGEYSEVCYSSSMRTPTVHDHSQHRDDTNRKFELVC